MSLRSLKPRADELGGNVDGMIPRNVGHFLTGRQQEHDRCGRAAFVNQRALAARLAERADLPPRPGDVYDLPPVSSGIEWVVLEAVVGRLLVVPAAFSTTRTSTRRAVSRAGPTPGWWTTRIRNTSAGSTARFGRRSRRCGNATACQRPAVQRPTDRWPSGWCDGGRFERR